MAENNVFLTPTLVTYATMASSEFKDFLPPESTTKNEAILQVGLESIKIAHEAGVTMCYGTDLLGPLGIAQAKEFGLRAQVLDNKTVLQSATVNPAKMLRQENRLGQIKEGFAADLLVLDGNPLEDLGVLEGQREGNDKLLVVMKEGRVWFSKSRDLPKDVGVDSSWIA